MALLSYNFADENKRKSVFCKIINEIMTENKYLYCYTMTHDTGFAPNPEHNVLTLATCKPAIRRCAQTGTWISGWAGVKVYKSQDKKDFVTGNAQRLIYLARITKKISFEEYWKNEEYQKKKPQDSICGDNIYEPDINEEEGFKIHTNKGGHYESNKKHDLSGVFVLICNEFYYFGVENALPMDVGVPFVINRCKKILLKDEKAQSIIYQVKINRNKCKYYRCL